MNTAKEFKRLGEYTYKHYRDDLNRYWSHLFDVPMVAVGPRDLRKVLSKVKGKPKHKQNVFAPVRGGFKHAQSEGWIDTNPCLAISFGKTQKPPPDYFKPREQEDLLSKMEGQSYRYAKLFFETGMRPCETLAIYEYDIDFDEATLTVERAIVDGKPQPYTKTHKIRKVYLTPDAVLVLKQQLPHSVKGKLFNWMTTKVPHEAMREAMRGAEMRVRRPYCARHTRASTLLTTMEDAAFSARQLGHSQYTFQTVYASWIDELENKDKAAAITGIKTKPKLELVQAEGV
ncbi:MAG: tyrosine-type recombinase/integrase [Pseudomonadota bacterium]